MKRFLKQHVSGFLPGVVRAALKRRFEAEFNSPVDLDLVVEETELGICCTVDKTWSFLIPLARKDDLAYLTTGSHGRGEFCSIARVARSGGVLFDVGAHSGLISALFCAANPKNKVFSFEPSSILAERLSAIRQLNAFGDRMRIEQIGIGESTATIEMLLDPSGGFVQAQRFNHTMWAAPEAVRIQMESIADAAARLDAIPQYVKLDIEGYEYEAIKGSLEFLSRHRPTIFLELHLNYLEQRMLSARLVIEMLGQCGYLLFKSSGSQLDARTLYDSPLSNIHLVAR